MGLTAKTFGARPSELLGLSDPVVAYAVDEAVAIRLRADEQRAEQAAGKGSIDPNQRYETAADLAEYASGVN